MDSKEWLQNYLDRASKVLLQKDIPNKLVKLREVILNGRAAKANFFFAGNGASTTIASHAALDFSNQLNLKGISLNDPNFITCFSNDFGYENFMARNLQIYAEENDVVVLISSSGESENIIRAAEIAKEKGCHVVGFSGFKKDNRLSKLSDLSFWVDSEEYNVVETTHMTWLVSVCDRIAFEEIDQMGIHGRLLGTPNEKKK